MKTTRFLITALSLTAIITFSVSCGGNANKQQTASGTATETGALKKTEGGNKWPDNDFTKQVPKPDFAINSTDGVDVSERRVVIRFGDAKPTKEELATYWEKVKAAGFTLRPMNADDGSSFSASNDAGYRVELDIRSLRIGKQRPYGYGIE